VLDGDGHALEDALVETWQANAGGRYRHPIDDREGVALLPGFTGAGRATTDARTGLWNIRTIKPGVVPGENGSLQAPHLCIIVQARGLLGPLFTRLYFPEDAELHERDAVLLSVDEARRPTLIAELTSAPTAAGHATSGSDLATYRFVIRLQGERETVFFDL
jgi:protocatechuate 3,4-dioxygenase, alpha subunit